MNFSSSSLNAESSVLSTEPTFMLICVVALLAAFFNPDHDILARSPCSTVVLMSTWSNVGLRGGKESGNSFGSLLSSVSMSSITRSRLRLPRLTLFTGGPECSLCGVAKQDLRRVQSRVRPVPCPLSHLGYHSLER